LKYLKDNAIGVDKEINSIINKIDKALNPSWGIDIYHKIYRERDVNDLFAPFAFLSDKEYKEVFINDKAVGEVGFYLNNTRDVDGYANVDCDVIFSINLDKIDNGSLQREDERAIMMAYDAVNGYRSNITQIKTTLRSVFSDFNQERIKYRDMQPYLNFSFTLNINYKNNNCYGM
jgi:hypothetical protein